MSDTRTRLAWLKRSANGTATTADGDYGALAATRLTFNPGASLTQTVSVQVNGDLKVEADETFILESFKGKRGKLLRPARKRGGKASKRGLSSEQTPIVVARDRSGATIDAVLARLDIASMTVALGHAITIGAVLCCDGGKAICGFARRARVKTHMLDAPGHPTPDAPQFHINNVNAYHSRLKEWMRRFHGVATDNLPNYLSWRRTIEAMANASTPDAWIMGAAGLGPYQQRSG